MTTTASTCFTRRISVISRSINILRSSTLLLRFYLRWLLFISNVSGGLRNLLLCCRTLLCNYTLCLLLSISSLSLRLFFYDRRSCSRRRSRLSCFCLSCCFSKEKNKYSCCRNDNSAVRTNDLCFCLSKVCRQNLND